MVGVLEPSIYLPCPTVFNGFNSILASVHGVWEPWSSFSALEQNWNKSGIIHQRLHSILLRTSPSHSRIHRYFQSFYHVIAPKSTYRDQTQSLECINPSQTLPNPLLRKALLNNDHSSIVYNRMMTSTQGNLHSFLPRLLLNHSNPRPAHLPTSPSISPSILNPGPGAMDELLFVMDEEDSGRGSNQWPLFVSRKQRSDQWQEEVKRISIITEQ